MSKLYLSFVLTLLAFGVACGSSSGGNGPSGPFSNASLNGQYVYQISGFDFNINANGAPYRESGVFSANGAQQITGGIDDFVESGSGSTNPITGSYNINGTGTGFIHLNVGTAALTFAVTMVSTSKVYLIEADGGFNSSGLGEFQDSTAIAAAPSGTFTFRTHILNAPPALSPTATVGAMTIASANVTGGSEDSLTLNTTSVPLSLTGGTLSAPDSNGRGQFSLKDNSPKTTNFVYYIVDANNVRLLASDPGFTGQGSAEKQNGTLDLSGNYAFGSQGDTNNFGLGGVDSAGRFNAGAGAISSGAVDTVQDGVSVVNKTFTGSFTPVNSSGRTMVTFSTGSNALFWMVSPSRAFFMFNESDKVEDGTVSQQLVSSFSNSTTNGPFALVMGGFDVTPEFINRVGTLQWDGNGNLTFNEFVNNTPLGQNTATLKGSYQVSGNGRTAATINGISLANGDQVFYLISASDAYFLINDSGVQFNGTMSKQP